MFKAVKIPTSNISDSELKTRCFYKVEPDKVEGCDQYIAMEITDTAS